MNIERIDLDEWAGALPNQRFDVFHAPEPLSILESHTTADLHLYGGFKGEHAVALLPVFVRESAVGRAIMSPPPSMGVPHLGPVMAPNSPKRRKQESANRTFVEGVLNELDAHASSSLSRIMCHPEYSDPRPFGWAGFEIQPSFTYVLDTSSSTPDALLSSFTRSLRRDITKGEDLDLTVSIEGVEAARQEYDQIKARYAEADEPAPFTWEYIKDIVTGLDDRCRVYTVRDGSGTFLSAVIVLYSNDVAYFWAGGTRATYENLSVNSLLHWRIIKDIIEDPPFDSVTRYDLVGANTERLCEYKAKFGADLVPYYVVESGGPAMNLAKKAYQFVRG